jgi:transposase
MGRFVEYDRTAPMLLAPDMQDWLDGKHLARFIVEVVDRIELRAIEASYRGRGERAYHPKMLLALLVYGYATGIFSSRKLERACVDSISFRYIAANTTPDHDTIADFRCRVLPELPRIFLEILSIAQEMGFAKLGTLSLDGTKIKANASKHHALSYAHAGKIKAKLRREVSRLLKLAEAADHERDPELNIPAEIARREDLINKIDQARAKIEEREAQRHAEARAKHAERLAARREQERQTGKKVKGRRPRAPKLRVEPTAQINLTDEESRIMPTADGFVQGYNCQATVSMDHFIVITDVTQASNDKEQIAPALEQLGALPIELGVPNALLADAGYFSAKNVEQCEKAGIVPYIAMRREKHHGWLTTRLRKRLPEPGSDATSVERMLFRMQTDEGRKLYGKRKSTVETTFGNVKGAMGFRSFLLRGHGKVRGEWKLVCTAYNLKHLHRLDLRRIEAMRVPWALAG